MVCSPSEVGFPGARVFSSAGLGKARPLRPHAGVQGILAASSRERLLPLPRP